MKLSYVCHSDSYTPTADVFESVEEFLEMCQQCFGQEPDLLQQGEDYHDELGLVLEAVVVRDFEVIERAVDENSHVGWQTPRELRHSFDKVEFAADWENDEVFQRVTQLSAERRRAAPVKYYVSKPPGHWDPNWDVPAGCKWFPVVTG